MKIVCTVAQAYTDGFDAHPLQACKGEAYARCSESQKGQ